MAEDEDLEVVARACVEYATWFIREGCDQFRQRQAGFRKALATSLSTSDETPDDLAAAEAVAAAASATLLPVETHPAEWAQDRTDEIVTACGEYGWRLLLLLVRAAPDDPHLLGFIGAGPFEDWVTEERVCAVREEFAREWRAEPKFRLVVRASWNVPPALERLLAELADS